MPMKVFDPKIWIMDPIPYFLNFWLFKTNHVVGQGTWDNYQKVVSSVTLRIIVSGSWELNLCGTSHKANHGDIFCSLPSEHFYFRQTDPDVRFEWRELCFVGPAAERFVSEFGLSKDNPVITPKEAKGARKIFKKIESLMTNPARTVPEMLSLIANLTKICNQQTPNSPDRQSPHELLVAKAMEQMEATPAYIGSIKQLAKSLGVERSTLYRAFKSQLGISVHDYVDRTRRARAGELLLYSDMSNSEIAEILGFSNDKYFITWFKSTHGQPPKASRIANRGKLT